MSNFDVNIDAAAVISQNEKESYVSNRTKNVFNANNYLNARLLKGELTKKLKIRLLPFSPQGGSPFKKVFIHTVRITKEDGQSWKTFICPVHNHKGDKCPFCETAEQARQLRMSATTDVEKQKYGDIEFMNKAKEAWIVRCIDREHEEDGVKFWMFNASRKKDGVYDKIMNLFNERLSEAREQGQNYNIFDLNNGKDLNITLTRDSNNKTVTQITDSSFQTPLSTDAEKGEAWIHDAKEWDKMYTVKSYDYMAIIVQGGIPVWDSETNSYVDKKDHDAKVAQAVETELKENLTEQKKDFTQFVEDKIMDKPQETVNNAATANSQTSNQTPEPVATPSSSVSKEDIFIDENDLPF